MDYKKYVTLISDHLGIDESEIKPESLFVDDFGCDSLDTIELIMALEEDFKCEIPDEKLEFIKSVKDGWEYILANTRP